MKGSRIGGRLCVCRRATPFFATAADGRVVADAIILDHAPIASTWKKRRRLRWPFWNPGKVVEATVEKPAVILSLTCFWFAWTSAAAAADQSVGWFAHWSAQIPSTVFRHGFSLSLWEKERYTLLYFRFVSVHFLLLARAPVPPRKLNEHARLISDWMRVLVALYCRTSEKPF